MVRFYGSVKGHQYRNLQPEYVPLEMKRCTKCGIVKPITEFYKDKNNSGKTVRKARCKTCYDEATMEAYERRKSGYLREAR